MVAKHKVGIHQKIFVHNCLVSGKKGANVLETLVSGDALFCKSPITRQTPYPYTSKVPWYYSCLTQLGLFPSERGEGGGELCTHSMVCAWYI
jgi:hypothetical protein